MPRGARRARIAGIHRRPGAGPRAAGAVELLGSGVPVRCLPDIELTVAETIPFGEAGAARGALETDIEVKRAILEIITEEEGHVRRVSGIDECGVLPGSASEIGQSPEIPGRGVESPEGSAMRMAETRRGLLAEEVDPINETTTRSPEIRLEKRAGARAIETTEFELTRACHDRSGAVIHFPESEACINDATTCLVDVEVTHPSPALGDRGSVGECVRISARTRIRHFDLVVHKDPDSVGIERESSDPVRSSRRRVVPRAVGIVGTGSALEGIADRKDRGDEVVGVRRRLDRRRTTAATKHRIANPFLAADRGIERSHDRSGRRVLRDGKRTRHRDRWLGRAEGPGRRVAESGKGVRRDIFDRPRRDLHIEVRARLERGGRIDRHRAEIHGHLWARHIDRLDQRVRSRPINRDRARGSLADQLIEGNPQVRGNGQTARAVRRGEKGDRRSRRIDTRGFLDRQFQERIAGVEGVALARVGDRRHRRCRCQEDRKILPRIQS